MHTLIGSRRPVAVLAVFLAFFSVSGLAGVPFTAETVVDEDGSYITTGSLTLPADSSYVRSMILAYASYGAWMPRGQDGKDDRSARFSGQLTGVEYLEIKNALKVLYNINLFWPLGSTGNSMFFAIEHPELVAADEGVAFNLLNPSIGIDFATLSFSIKDSDASEGDCTMVIRLKARLAWILRQFFPPTSFHKHLSSRVGILMNSFMEYIGTGRPAD